MPDLFFYGTLRHAPLLNLVLGREVPTDPATAPGYTVIAHGNDDTPALVRAPHHDAIGCLARGLSLADIDRLEFYEYEPKADYRLTPISVETPEGMVEAHVFHAGLSCGDGPRWVLRDWVAAHAPRMMRVAAEYMGLYGHRSAEAADRIYPQMLVRGASAARAAASPKPARIRSDTRSDSIDLRSVTQPYTNFFALTEQRLRFPRFDGTMSPEIEREGFLGGDAVTVLPYDPVRDRVLVIEQFRFSPFMRGDPLPWVLEPVAGRIDPGETPEQTAARELIEEARVELKELHHVANYYPSPSCFSEYIYSYIGICDLPDDAAGIGGLDSEAEDIRSHILTFERAYQLIFDGEADAAPLIMSLMWLAHERERLRNSA